MQSKHIDKTRSWRKATADWMLTAFGWENFTTALHQHYKNDGNLPKLIEDTPSAEDTESTDNLIPTLSLEHCFVNLALIEQIKHKEQEQAWISGRSSAATTLNREEIYQSLLNEGKTRGIDAVFDKNAMITREETNWAFIVGRAGTGKTTLLQYISHRWGLGEAIWNNRFEFVFRAKLNLVGQENFWNNIPDSSGIGRLAWLISHSLDTTTTPPFTFENIRMCLTRHPKQILLLLDGYDEVHSMYGSDSALTSLIDTAMTFPNGILTARPKVIPASLLPRNNPSKLQRLELLGLTQDEVKRYVLNYFNEIAQPQLGQTLLTQLNCNPEMLGLAQIPVNISAICLTWQEEQSPITSMTMLYQRVVVCLARRYDKNFKLTAKEKRDGINPATILEETELDRCKDELQILAKLAYDGFVRNEIQSLSDTLLQKHFPKDNPLLHRITAQFGMLRKSATPIKKGEYHKHYFIHLTYQEYFAALHIAQQLSAISTTDIDEEIKRRQTIQDLVCFIQTKKNNPRYAIIWRFLAGLLATPQYTLGANYFWDIFSESTTVDDEISVVIGMSPQSKTLQSYHEILKEGLLMHYTYRIKTANLVLPQILSILKDKIFNITAWDSLRQIEELVSALDDSLDKNDDAVYQLYNQQKKQYQHDRKIFELPEIEPLTISTLLSQIPLWASQLHTLREHVIHRDNSICKETIDTLRDAGIKDEHILSRLRKLLEYKAIPRGTDVTSRMFSESVEQNTRKDAAIALGKLRANDEATLSALRNVVKNKEVSYDGANRTFAAQALGEIGSNDEETLSALQIYLKDAKQSSYCPHTPARVAAVLIQLGEQNENILEAVRSSRLSSEYKSNLIGQAEANKEPTLTELKASLQSSNNNVRAAAVKAIYQLRLSNQQLLDLLRPLLKSSDKNICLTALKVIEQNEVGVEDNTTLRALQLLLKDSDENIQIATVKTLHTLGPGNKETFCSVLRPLLKSTNPEIRKRTIKTLGLIEVKDDATLSELRLLQRSDNNESVQIAVTKILYSLGECNEDGLSTLSIKLKSANKYVRRDAVAAIKKIIPTFHNVEILKILLQKMDDTSETDIKVTQDICIALFKTPPIAYAMLPELLTNTTVQRFFVISTWLHASTVLIKDDTFTLVIKDKQANTTSSVFTLSGTAEQLQRFATQINDFQTQLIQATASCSEQLPGVLNNLNQSVSLPSPTPLPDFKTLYEQKLRLQQNSNINENLKRLEDMLKDQYASIENIKALLLSLTNQNANQQPQNGGQPNPYSPEQNTYMKQFKQTLIEMHHIAFATSIGVIPLTPSNHANAASIILNIASNTIPVVGGAAKVLAYLIKFADTQLTKKRMENLKQLGSPDEIPATSNHISARLFHCRDLDNADETILSKLLSGAEDALESYSTDGYYGALFSILDNSTETQKDTVTLEERATQDAQYFIAAIAKNGVPTEKTGAAIINQLFLYSAPISATMKALFLILLKKFCDANNLIVKNVSHNSFKRNGFFGQAISSWHDKADAVSTRIEKTETRDAFIEKLADNYASTQHPKGIGIFYLKPKASSRISIYNNALTAEFSEEVLRKTLNSC